MYQENITNEEISKLPLKAFEGEIIIVDSEDKIEEAYNYLIDREILGFDTETKPSFKKGVENMVALVQLSTLEKAYLFRLNKIGLPDKLIEIFTKEDILKVGLALSDDIRVLKKMRNFSSKSFLELQEYVKSYRINCFSLKKLSALVLGIRISKKQQVSNWELEELSEGQIKYAATDAWAAKKIYLSLRNNKI